MNSQSDRKRNQPLNISSDSNKNEGNNTPNNASNSSRNLDSESDPRSPSNENDPRSSSNENDIGSTGSRSIEVINIPDENSLLITEMIEQYLREPSTHDTNNEQIIPNSRRENESFDWELELLDEREQHFKNNDLFDIENILQQYSPALPPVCEDATSNYLSESNANVEENLTINSVPSTSNQIVETLNSAGFNQEQAKNIPDKINDRDINNDCGNKTGDSNENVVGFTDNPRIDAVSTPNELSLPFTQNIYPNLDTLSPHDINNESMSLNFGSGRENINFEVNLRYLYPSGQHNRDDGVSDMENTLQRIPFRPITSDANYSNYSPRPSSVAHDNFINPVSTKLNLKRALDNLLEDVNRCGYEIAQDMYNSNNSDQLTEDKVDKLNATSYINNSFLSTKLDNAINDSNISVENCNNIDRIQHLLALQEYSLETNNSSSTDLPRDDELIQQDCIVHSDDLHHKNSGVGNPNEPSTSNQKWEIYCPLCPKSYNHKNNLENHLIEVHKKCLVCANFSKAFNSKTKLKKPKIELESKLNSCKCPNASNRCKTRPNPRNQIRKIRPIKPLICSNNDHKTGKEVKDGNSISTTSIKCQVCNKAFDNKAKLRYHMKRVHTDLPDHPYICPRCNSKFKTSLGLENHKSYHTF